MSEIRQDYSKVHLLMQITNAREWRMIFSSNQSKLKLFMHEKETNQKSSFTKCKAKRALDLFILHLSLLSNTYVISCTSYNGQCFEELYLIFRKNNIEVRGVSMGYTIFSVLFFIRTALIIN